MNKSLLAQMRSPACSRLNAGIPHNYLDNQLKPGMCPRCGGKTTSTAQVRANLVPATETRCPECGWWKLAV